MNEAFKKLAEEFRDATPTTERDIATLKLMPIDRKELPTDIVDGYLGTIDRLPDCPECELFFMDAGREQDSSIEIFKELAGKAGGRLPKADDDIRLSGPIRIMRWCRELFRTFGRTEWKHDKSWLNGNAFERSAELCERLAGEGKTPQIKADTPIPTVPLKATKIYLKTWHDIAVALDMFPDIGAVKSLAKDHDAPIVWPKGRGKKPKCEKGELIEWFERIAIKLRDERDQATENHLQTYQHGKSGTVVPEIGGHIKKRRNIE